MASKCFSIGVDTSSTHTAIIVLDNKGALFSQHLIEPKSKDLRTRGQIIYNDTVNIINRFDPTCTVITIEAPALMAKGKVVDLAMITGSIYYSLNTYYNVSLIPPTTIKKFFTGNGRAGKEDMIEKCPADLLDLFKAKHKKIDDLVDGYALAMYGLLN